MLLNNILFFNEYPFKLSFNLIISIVDFFNKNINPESPEFPFLFNSIY